MAQSDSKPNGAGRMDCAPSLCRSLCRQMALAIPLRSTAVAQEYKAVALVNGQVISSVDVEGRTRLLRMASDTPITSDNIQLVREAALNELICRIPAS